MPTQLSDRLDSDTTSFFVQKRVVAKSLEILIFIANNDVTAQSSLFYSITSGTQFGRLMTRTMSIVELWKATALFGILWRQTSIKIS